MEKQKLEAQFQIQDMLPIGMTLVVFGIAIAYGLNVQEDVETTFGEDTCAARTDGFTTYTGGVCSNGTATSSTGFGADFNATGDAISGVAKLPEKLPLIVTVVVAAIVIGILVRYLFMRFS